MAPSAKKPCSEPTSRESLISQKPTKRKAESTTPAHEFFDVLEEVTEEIRDDLPQATATMTSELVRMFH